MATSQKPQFDTPAIAALLAAHLGSEVSDIAPLDGGNFSRAFAFQWQGGAYVLRLNPGRDGFDKDRFVADAFVWEGVPIPRILTIGETDGVFFAISERATGATLDALTAPEREACVPSLIATLDAIHHTDVTGYRGYGYFDAHGVGMSAGWRQFLVEMFDETIPGWWLGWRSLFDTSLLERDLFERGYARMIALLPYCSEERALLHSDFTFDNILADGVTITGVIDWQGAMYGDPLFDVANLDIWHGSHGFVEHFRRYYALHGGIPPHFAERVACYGYCKRLDGLRFFARTGQQGAYAFIRAQLVAQLDDEEADSE